MNIQISTLPSWVTGSRLSESLERPNVKMPPADPDAAAVGGALAGAAVTFWFTVTGPLVAGAAPDSAPGVDGLAPHAASSGAAAPTLAMSRRKRRRLNLIGMSAGCAFLSITVVLLSGSSANSSPV